MRISGWGRYPVVECATASARGIVDVQRLLAGHTSLIPRGNGRSYGDASLNPELTLSMTNMDRFLAFDSESGHLTCEAGATLADILASFAPRGWFPPVVPGTKFVTVGGMIAADVHGKNHHAVGSFGSHVESLCLVTGDGKVLRCSRTEHPQLFSATLGGMGLTGVIVSAVVRLTPIASQYLDTETLATSDLDATLQLLEESHAWPFNVAWVDASARGANLGRALVTRGRWATKTGRADIPDTLPRRRPVRLPVDFPSGLLNGLVGRAFNELYYRLGRSRSGRPQLADYDAFFFPLDGVGEWNRVYGRKGFLQFQCALPPGTGRQGVAQLLQAIPGSGAHSYLAVLKLFGPSGEGLISFPIEGTTLALDFPATRHSVALLGRYDQIAASLGGRVYLAKDACTTAARFKDGYPNVSAFSQVRRKAPAKGGVFESMLSKRLAL